MKKIKQYIYTALVLCSLCACSKFLDIVPDYEATIQTSFTLEHSAKKYLYTCYSWLPDILSVDSDPGFGFWGGEIWGIQSYEVSNSFYYATGGQGTVNPYLNYWDGGRGGSSLYKAVRDCNIFLDNIGNVSDMRETERARWIAEVKFLKAYYTFWLVRQYGPIPLMKENLPISASPDQVKRFRDPVDSCFDYIVSLLDEAIPDLPAIITDRAGELGRVTSVAAASFKAKVLVYAASPLFNGNTDYAGLVDKRGIVLFPQKYDPDKWKKAAEACKQAIDICEGIGMELFRFQPTGVGVSVSDTTITKMSIRGAFADKNWNSELIWGGVNDVINQYALTPVTWDPDNFPVTNVVYGRYGPSLEFASLFYTNHGLPIEEDKDWDYTGRFQLHTATAADKYNIAQGYITANFNFNREPRFYADLGFDGGIWYGQGRYNDNDTWVLKCKLGQPAGFLNNKVHTPTGYFPKKLIYYENTLTSPKTYHNYWYPVARMRLAGLYLLYAEALNEDSGPGPEIFEYLDKVRERAGLPGIQDAWTNYAKHPGQYKTKEGLREIIHRERNLELAFEGEYYWDQRRWKTAEKAFNTSISGWSIRESDAVNYYKKTWISQQVFNKRDYLDPIEQSTILDNSNLVQNPGW